jgi:hypothetical protein
VRRYLCREMVEEDPKRDERKSRIERSRAVLVLVVALLIFGGFVLVDVNVWAGLVLIVLAFAVLLPWMKFPYQLGRFSWFFSAKDGAARYSGELTDPRGGDPSASEAREDLSEQPARDPRPGRLRRLARWRPRNKESAED